jgi:hypothetical protein
MHGRFLLGAAVAVLALAGAAWWALDRETAVDDVAGAVAVPGLAARVDAIDRIEVLGAGDASLVVLEKRDGAWTMPSRGGWPGNQREIGSALHRLGSAKRVEAKTADPDRHAKLGVEDVSAATAKGTELRLSGGGEPIVVVIGRNHPALGGSYVRLGDDPQAWLIDEDVAPQREPGAWLDRRLLDLPMARIERIRVTPAAGPAYVLARVDDRFTPDGASPSALADPDDGNAAAGFTDQLALDDVADDDGHAPASTVVFESVDGIAVTVAAWQDERGAWARLSATLDEKRARAWFERAATATTPVDADARVAELRTQVEQWQARFDGRRFLLPAHKAQYLLKARADYFGDAR